MSNIASRPNLAERFWYGLVRRRSFTKTVWLVGHGEGRSVQVGYERRYGR